MAGHIAPGEAAVDVKRTLKFIGRLALRLHSNAGESADPQALEAALQEALKSLPNGVVKGTLESDLARFTRALVDRVVSLQTVKTVKGDSALAAAEGEQVALDLDGLAAKDLVSNAGYTRTVDAVVSRWGGRSVGAEDEEIGRWRDLCFRALIARPVVPEALAAAYVNLETEAGRKTVQSRVGVTDGNPAENQSEISLAETVTSSVVEASACLAPQTRLLLIPPLTALLSKATEVFSESAALSQNSNKSPKRLYKLARALLTIHTIQLKQSVETPSEAFRTGALLAVAVVVTKYLVLTKGVGGTLGDAHTAKLKQTAFGLQAILAAEVRGPLVGLLSLSEESESVRSLGQVGADIVRGVLHEAALVRVPFEKTDVSLGAWAQRVELARKAVALFRANGERTRAAAIVTAVIDPEGLSHVAAAASSRLESLRAVLPSEGLANDSRGFTTWLVGSASEAAFAAALAALRSDPSAATAPDHNLETCPQQSPPQGGAEPLFYIDKTGAGPSADPTEERILAVVGQMAREGVSEKNGKRKGKKERKERPEGNSDVDESHESGRSASDGEDSSSRDGSRDGSENADIGTEDEDVEKAQSNGSERAEETQSVDGDEMDDQELDRADLKIDANREADRVEKLRTEYNDRNIAGSWDPRDEVRGSDDSSDVGMHPDEFIARMYNLPYVRPTSGPEFERQERNKKQWQERIKKKKQHASRPAITGKEDNHERDTDGNASRGEERTAPTTPREVGLPPVAVGKKADGSGGAKPVVEEGGSADDLSPLHTRSGRTVLASPGPGSAAKRKSVTSPGPGSTAKRPMGKSKAALSTVVETEAEANPDAGATGGKKRLETEGGEHGKNAPEGAANGVGGTESETVREAVESEQQPEASAPPTGRKRKKAEVEAATTATADEDYVSPLHTRSGKVVAAPSTIKKTATKKKRGPLDEVAGEGTEADDVSPLHTRSGRAVGATATPAPATAKKSRGAGTPAGGASALKRLRN